jgi:hypothetical protein
LQVGRNAVLCIAATRHEGAHAITFAPALCVAAARRNRAGHFQSGDITRARRGRIFALALHQVGPVHSGRRDADQHLSPFRLRQRHLNRLKHFRSAGFSDADDNHVRIQ